MKTTTQNIYYVYQHTFKNNTCYIGKGKDKRGYSRLKRNRHWVFLYNKYGMPEIKIIEDNLEEKIAILELQSLKNL